MSDPIYSPPNPDNWNDIPPRYLGPYGPFGVVLGIIRALLLIILTFGCLLIMVLVRVIEKPIFGEVRPVTPFITQFVCKGAFIILGMKREVIGKPMKHKGAFVANHVSWMDIFTLNASKRIYFVAKSEIAKWPGISWLAKATGTLFIKRERAEAARQQKLFEARLNAGHKLMFFPEGTSTDGFRVLPFKSTLFEAFFTMDVDAPLYIQPMTLTYKAPEGHREPRFFGWWGTMALAPSLIGVLAAWKQGEVIVEYHEPINVQQSGNRKSLAADLENAVRAGLYKNLAERAIIEAAG